MSFGDSLAASGEQRKDFAQSKWSNYAVDSGP